jgi:hypothetical protein
MWHGEVVVTKRTAIVLSECASTQGVKQASNPLCSCLFLPLAAPRNTSRVLAAPLLPSLSTCRKQWAGRHWCQHNNMWGGITGT